jgi:hypothetical protein
LILLRKIGYLIRREFKAFTVPVVNNESRNFAE